MGVYDDFIKQLEKTSFSEKIKLVKDMNDRFPIGFVNHHVWELEVNGYLKQLDYKTVYCDDGDYYVYLWRHAWGDPFYVGSGKKNRWTSKNNRCNDFYLHLDMGDAVVYKILDGVDSHTARMFEEYISVNLVEAGYTLANSDNNTEYMTECARLRRIENCAEIDKHELASKIQNTILNILSSASGCDYRVTDQFLMKNGTDYFSRSYMKKRRN